MTSDDVTMTFKQPLTPIINVLSSLSRGLI